MAVESVERDIDEVPWEPGVPLDFDRARDAVNNILIAADGAQSDWSEDLADKIMAALRPAIARQVLLRLDDVDGNVYDPAWWRKVALEFQVDDFATYAD